MKTLIILSFTLCITLSNQELYELLEERFDTVEQIIERYEPRHRHKHD
jgi:hypothetical protein